LYQKIFNEVEKIKDEIIILSKNIHNNPELGFKEYKTSNFIKDLLKKHNFTIEENVGGLDTAFKARSKGKEKGPAVAFLAEYDALPEIGHGCGHNLIAATSTAAAIALSKLMHDMPGEVILIGTPAEEGGGGKIILLEKGVFDDVDYALMAHPSTKALIGRKGLATTDIKLEFFGKAAHSSAPEDGINALQAVIQTFNMIDSVRAQFPLKATINGIITKGGTAANIIPDYASCELCPRAKTVADLDKVIDKINTVVKAAETLTGATSKMSMGSIYAERYSNRVMDEIYKKYMEIQGEKVEYPDPDMKVGSSDIGNVSLKVPTIHPYFKIADPEVKSHSKDFANAAITDRAHESAIKTAKALACTAYEILTNEKVREEIRREFEEAVPKDRSNLFCKIRTLDGDDKK
jgi:amidohydrolase